MNTLYGSTAFSPAKLTTFKPLRPSASLQTISHISPSVQTMGLAALAYPMAHAQNNLVHVNKPKSAITPERVLTALAKAGGLIGVALLLRRLPARRSSFPLISSDWKDYAKIALGSVAVGQINEGFQWSPPPWLGALESVAVINPLVTGFTKLGLKQMAVIAPMVAVMVELAARFNEAVEKPLKDRNISPWISKVATTAAMMVVGIKGYPILFDKVAKTGLLGASVKNSVTVGAASVGIVCARGCCQSVVCLNELGEVAGGLGNWFRSNQRVKQS